MNDTHDHVGSCVLVHGDNVRDASAAELPRVVSIIAVAKVQTVQDLHGTH